MSEMLSITLPDGSVREVERGTTPADVAAAIGPGLAKAALAARVNGEVRDLARPFEEDSELALITARDEADALELARHDFAHVLAEAVQNLYPGHADHLRPGDRRRLLLRFRADGRARPLHRGGSAGDRGGDAPDHRRRRAAGARGLDARRRPRLLREAGRDVQGRMGDGAARGRGDHHVPVRRLARPVPRPASRLDRQARSRRRSS